MVRVTLENGQRKTAYASTLRDAKKKLQEMRVLQAQGQLLGAPTQKVKAYLEDWLTKVHDSVRPRTFESYALNVRRLMPIIGHHRLDALQPSHIDAAYAHLRTAGLSKRSVEQVHTVLHTALKRAVKLRLLTWSPCDAVSPPRPERTEMRTLSIEQVRQLFDVTADDRLHALWVLLVTTGLRVGEATALTWGDIDLDAASLSVRRALQRQTGKGLVFVEPKTARSRRTVLMAASTVMALRRHWLRQQAERTLLGMEWTECGLVFTNTTGGPLDAGNVRESFGRRLKAAGLPPLRVHDLRHTAATFLLSQGAHPKLVQDMLGHSTIALTLDTYSHVMPAVHRDAADKMETLFDTAIA